MQFQSSDVDAVREVLQQILGSQTEPEISIAELEAGMMAFLMTVGRAFLTQVMESRCPKQAFVDGDDTWKPTGLSKKQVISLFGKLHVKRQLFRQVRNGKTRCFVKEQAPLVVGLWTEGAAALAAKAMAEMPGQRAEEFFRDAGIMNPSRSSMQRLVLKLSELWENNREDNERAVHSMCEIPSEAMCVAVSLDGVMVLLTDSDKAAKKTAARIKGKAAKGPSGHREASVGVLSFYDAEGERLDTQRYGRMPESNKLATKSWLTQEIARVRELRPDLITLAIADGAANNWTFFETLGADHELVDFFHTAEHLHRHASKALEASSVETQATIARMRQSLLKEDDGAQKVFDELEALRRKAGTQDASSRKTKGKRQPTYFERHGETRMNYPLHLAENLPIGSGVTESSCKLVVCDRMRRTGMRWSVPGGQAVLTLRSHLESGRFENAMTRLFELNACAVAA